MYDTSSTYSEYLRSTTEPKYYNPILKSLPSYDEEPSSFTKRSMEFTSFKQYTPFEKDYNDMSLSMKDMKIHNSKYDIKKEESYKIWSEKDTTHYAGGSSSTSYQPQ